MMEYQKGDTKLEVYAVNLDYDRAVAVVVREVGIGFDHDMNLVYSDGVLTKTEGGSPAPLLKLDRHLMKEVWLALCRLYESQGTKPPSQDRVDGELAATRYHLEDMRTVSGVHPQREEADS